MKEVEGISGLINDGKPTSLGKEKKEQGFVATLEQAWRQLDDDIKAADQATEQFAVGGRSDIHEVMILTSKAELSFRLATAVRNKLLEAYREIMRTQL